MNVVSVVVDSMSVRYLLEGLRRIESVIDNFELKNFVVNLIRSTKGGYENGEEQLVRVTRQGNFQ